MHLTLRRAFAGALLAGLTIGGPLWSPAQAQSFATDDVSRSTAAEADMSSHIFNPPIKRGGIIYDNGDTNTGTTTSSGVVVPTPGYEWSEVQNDAGNLTESNTSAGATCTQTTTTSFRLGDDFVVPAGETWTITDVTTYAYQTGFVPGAFPSPVAGARLQIWDGPPNDPLSAVIFGDLTTDRLASSVEANEYRVFNTSVPPPGTTPGTTRRIFANTINVAPALELTEGTYWLDYQHVLATGTTMFCPSVTIVGDRGLPGWNALQFTGTSWVAYVDTGNPASAPDEPQDFPFELGGSIATGGCTPGPTVFCSTDTPLAIPDSPAPGVVSTITVAPLGGLTIDDLDIGFQATHSWVGDLVATVAHGATSVVVMDRPGRTTTGFGCSGNDPDIVADDEGTDGSLETSCQADPLPAYPVAGGHYTPNNALSAFDGLDATGTWTMTVADLAGGDTGTLDSWSLIVTEAAGPVVNTYPATGLPVPIPDSPAPAITSTITVPPSPNEVVDVDIEFALTHSWVGDIGASVLHGATTVTFMDRPGRTTTGFGCSGNDPDIVADDEGTDGSLETSCQADPLPAYPVAGGHYTPNNPLSAFDGLDVQGDWTLSVQDFAGGDTGTLDAWALVITEDIGTASPGEPTAGQASLRATPNPISNTGTVELTVPTAQRVRVAVYDMLGREVMVLLDRAMSVSQRAFVSLESRALTPGAYIIRAVGETFQTSQRVTITR